VDGEYTVVVRARDLAGNEREDSATFAIDTVGPMFSISSPIEGEYYNTSSVEVDWAIVDMGPCTTRLRLDGGDEVKIGSVTSYVIEALEHGAHTISLRVIDAAGNQVTGNVNFTVDLSPPTVEVLSPGDYSTEMEIQVALVLNGTGSPLGDIFFRLDAGSRTLIDDYLRSGDLTNFTFFVQEDGVHEFSVEVLDLAGNHMAVTRSVTVDTVSPSVVVHQPTGSEVSTDTLVKVRFSEAMDRDGVVFDMEVEGGIAWDVNELVFAPDGLLEPGMTYTVAVHGQDLAGNVVDHHWQFKTAEKGTVTGRVLDEEGAPLAGATITLDTGEIALTDAEGRFSVETNQGHHTATVTLDGDELGSFSFDVVAGKVNDSGDHEMEVPMEEGSSSWVILLVVLVLLVLLALIVIIAIARRGREEPDIWDQPLEE
jgi:hypothetical protein